MFYYTASRALDPAALKAVISRTLTAYMVPGVLMQLPEMPLTQNGKIDKKRLPKVEYKPERGVYAAPANAVEADFCGWFAELLRLDKVSADGNFLALGGTSLSGAIIAMNAADKGYPIVYADVFKAQTPEPWRPWPSVRARLRAGTTKTSSGAMITAPWTSPTTAETICGRSAGARSAASC